MSVKVNLQRPSTLQVWILAARPQTLPAGAAPVIVTATLAWLHGTFSLLPALAALGGSLTLQLTSNLVNDYADFERGADGDDRLGPARAAAKGWLTAQQLKRGAAVCAGLTLLLGCYLTTVGGMPILTLGIASICAAYAYTAGPFPLGYLGLGDLFVMLFFGFGAVFGTYYVCAGSIHPSLWSLSWAIGALATAILVVNNLRDRVQDQLANKRTLAVRFGERFAKIQYATLLYSALIVLVLEGCRLLTEGETEGVAFLSSLLIFPLCKRLQHQVFNAQGTELNPLLGATARLELLLCIILSIALTITYYLGG